MAFAGSVRSASVDPRRATKPLSVKPSAAVGHGGRAGAPPIPDQDSDKRTQVDGETA